MNNKYLDEKKYQKISKRLFLIGICIILFGIIIAIIMVIPKLSLGAKNTKEELQQQLIKLKPALEERYAELEEKGFEISYDYKNEGGYEMNLIDVALDPSYETCESSSRYSDNDTTREYCEVKAKLYESNHSSNAGGILFKIGPSLMILIPCLAIGLMFLITSKRRGIIAFTAQQVMPVAQEGLEKMAPTIGNVAKEISDGIRESREEDGN